jgi:predicted Zn-dependent protease
MIDLGTPNRAQRAAPAGRIAHTAAAALIAASAIVTSAARAQESAPNHGVPLIRDAETEQLLRDYTRPILNAAGLAKQNVKVIIINDRSFNAFVMDGRHIFVYAGALMEARTPNEMIGILAHETGHLAGGHLSRMRERMAAAQTQSIVAMLLGIGAMVATARSGEGGVGIAGAMAPAEAIRRSLLAYARTQEDQADHAAVKFLNATHQSPKGLLDTFKRLSSDTLFATHGVNPYLQTHPFPADRVATLEEIAKASPYWNAKDPPALQLRHDLVRAKLYGFLDNGDTVARRYPLSDMSLPAKYARAIATYRRSDLSRALPQIDALIQAEPGNPYFHELKGQALLEGGRAAEAVAPLRRAVQLAPNPALIQIMLAQAINASSQSAKSADEALSMLRSALTHEPEAPEAYAQMAIAFARKGDLAQADLASAQAAFYRGDRKSAEMLATRAKTRLPVGSPSWIRADDIVSAKRPKTN